MKDTPTTHTPVSPAFPERADVDRRKAIWPFDRGIKLYSLAVHMWQGAGAVGRFTKGFVGRGHDSSFCSQRDGSHGGLWGPGQKQCPPGDVALGHREVRGGRIWGYL